eukprot:1157638-Pelagomonas_calceolata.AAC.2
MVCHAPRGPASLPWCWMREPLVYGLLLCFKGSKYALNGRSSLHGTLSSACMHGPGMVCCSKVLLLPQALHINTTSVPGRTGFANFSASLATLPQLVKLTMNMRRRSCMQKPPGKDGLVKLPSRARYHKKRALRSNAFPVVDIPLEP